MQQSPMLGKADPPLLVKPLPDNKTPRSVMMGRLRLYALVFLVMLVTCEGMARVAVALGEPITDLPNSLYRKAELAAKKPEAGKPGVVFLGNSITYMALYSELLAARLGDAGLKVDVRSLASSNNSPIMDLALLRKAVDSGFKPQAVFVGGSLGFMRAGKGTFPLDEAFKSSYLYRCQLNKPARSLNGQALCALEKASYLARYRAYFKELLTQRLPGMVLKPEKSDPKSIWRNEEYVHTEISDGGWGPAYRVFSKQDYQKIIVQGEKGRRADAGMRDLLKHPPAYAAEPEFADLVAYCQAQGIPLVIMAMPGYSFPDGFWHKSPAYQAIVKTDRRTANAYLKKHPHVHLLDLTGIDDDSTHYADQGHRNAAGAVAFTNKLAQILVQEPYKTLLKGSIP